MEVTQEQQHTCFETVFGFCIPSYARNMTSHPFPIFPWSIKALKRTVSYWRMPVMRCFVSALSTTPILCNDATKKHSTNSHRQKVVRVLEVLLGCMGYWTKQVSNYSPPPATVFLVIAIAIGQCRCQYNKRENEIPMGLSSLWSTRITGYARLLFDRNGGLVAREPKVYEHATMLAYRAWIVDIDYTHI